MKTAAQALALLRREGALGLTPTMRLKSLVGEVVGGPVKGSWWAHSKGAVIYEIATALEDSDEVLVAKLVDGKVTFLHLEYWPALYRVVTDRAWRIAAKHGLGASAERLLAKVARVGTLRLDEVPAEERKAKAELEKRSLVQSFSEHTERGNHITVLRTWSAWASKDVKARAATLSRAEAASRLSRAGIDL